MKDKFFCKNTRWLIAFALGFQMLCFQVLCSQELLAQDAYVQDKVDSQAMTQLWDEQFSIALPERSRSIRLNHTLDAKQWIADNNLKDAKLMPLGSEGSVVDVPMNDPQWQKAQDSLCQQGGVELCEVTLCRAIQFGGNFRSGAHSKAIDQNNIKARLVRNIPEQLPADGEEGGSCRTPVVVALDKTTTAQNINLDVSSIQTAVDRESSSALSSVRQSPSTADSSVSQKTELDALEEQAGELLGPKPQKNKSFEYVLESSLGTSGELLVDATDLPEDTSEWTLVAGEGCSEVRIPLDSLEPAKRPGRVVALTDAGVAAQVAAAVGATLESEINLDTTNQSLAVFSTDDAVEQLIITLLLDPRVGVAQRDYIYRTTAESSAAQTPVYGDTFAGLTYGPKSTRALDLHSIANGEGQIIAIIDTGLDTEHPELIGRIEGEPINVTEYEWSADAHGTAIAGIVAANADNSEGIFGVAPKAKVLPIKACQPRTEGGMEARCFTSTLVKALDVAMTQNATLINMSISGPPDDLVDKYVQLALQQNRIVIAAAGNGGPNAKPGFPAAIPGVIAVTAIDANQRLYQQANHGNYIDIAAPGVDIISPTPGGNYPALSGTSMAAAHVTGVAALLKELAPELDGEQIAEWLTSSTHQLGDRSLFGDGLLDACSAAQHIAGDVCPTTTGVSDD